MINFKAYFNLYNITSKVIIVLHELSFIHKKRIQSAFVDVFRRKCCFAGEKIRLHIFGDQ